MSKYQEYLDCEHEFDTVGGYLLLCTHCDTSEETVEVIEEAAILEGQLNELLAACELGGIEKRDMKGPELLRLAARYLGEYDHKELHWLLNRKADAEEAAVAKARGENDE